MVVWSKRSISSIDFTLSLESKVYIFVDPCISNLSYGSFR